MASYVTQLEKKLEEEKLAREKLEDELGEIKKLLKSISTNFNLNIPL